MTHRSTSTTSVATTTPVPDSRPLRSQAQPRSPTYPAVRWRGHGAANLWGGLASKGHPLGASGLAMVYELVTQLRGEAGARQARGTYVAMAENGRWSHRLRRGDLRCHDPAPNLGFGVKPLGLVQRGRVDRRDRSPRPLTGPSMHQRPDNSLSYRDLTTMPWMSQRLGVAPVPGHPAQISSCQRVVAAISAREL